MKVVRVPPNNTGALEQAWADDETFVVQPPGDPAQQGWLEQTSLPDDLARHHFVLATSGTTGEPRLVVARRDRAKALARVLHRCQALEACARTVLVLPLHYAFPLVNQWLWAREHGRACVTTPGFSEPEAVREALRADEPTMLCLVGAQAQLLDQHFPGEVFPSVKRVNLAGGPFPWAWLPRLHEMFPAARILNNYGCTEAMPRLTLRDATEAVPLRDVGPPLDGVQVSVDAQGALLFRSPYGATAWITQGGGVHRVGAEEWVPTGDLGEVSSGRVLLLGRTGQVFKRHGEKVSIPRILQAVGLPWVRGAAALPVKDRHGEDGYVLVVAPVPNSGQVKELLQVFRRSFPRAAWPLRLESRASIPLTERGKPDLRTMAETPGGHVHWEQHL